jgi:hypothetical protein
MNEENLPAANPPEGEFLLYQTEDGQTEIECRFEGNSIWLTQKQLAELFQTSVPNINQHLKAIVDEGEILPAATIKKYLIVQTEGKREVSRQVLDISMQPVLSKIPYLWACIADTKESVLQARLTLKPENTTNMPSFTYFVYFD